MQELNYKFALIKYFARLSYNEKIIKCGSTLLPVFLNKYMQNAQYNIVVEPAIQDLLTEHKVFLVLNKDIEYNFPHTLDNIIIIFKEPTYELIIHELVHIYFRRNPMPKILVNFMKYHKLIVINRNKLQNEITNPDTYYNTGLLYKNRIIFIALMHSGTAYRPLYLTYIYGRGVRKATMREIDYYNMKLPYEQNYHPEEMIAEIISRN